MEKYTKPRNPVWKSRKLHGEIKKLLKVQRFFRKKKYVEDGKTILLLNINIIITILFSKQIEENGG